MKINLIYIAFLVFIISSCTKDANVKLPEIKPKPVVSCFISPGDSIITLKLTNSKPLYKNQQKNLPRVINDALVEISDGNANVRLFFVNDSIGYQSQVNTIPIVKGKTYTLTIKLNDGTILQSRTTTPYEIPELSFSDYLSVLVDSNEYYKLIRVTFNAEIKDKANEENEYRFVVYSSSVSPFDSSKTMLNLMTESYYSDKGKDGQVIKIPQNIELYFGGESMGSFNPRQIFLVLINGNTDYIKYHRDLQRYEFDNPFSEPVINFSNIEGGIGCFGAYTYSKIIFTP